MRLPRSLLAIGCAVCFAIGFLTISGIKKGFNQPELSSTRPHPVFEGREIGLVLVVAPDCGPCRDPGLPSAWRKIVEKAEANAVRDGAQVTLTGISVSSGPGTGFAFLESVGPFDEIVAGRGWENLGAMKFLRGDLSGPQSVPQVIVFQRMIIDDPHSPFHIFQEERILQRHIGATEIRRWADFR